MVQYSRHLHHAMPTGQHHCGSPRERAVVASSYLLSEWRLSCLNLESGAAPQAPQEAWSIKPDWQSRTCNLTAVLTRILVLTLRRGECRIHTARKHNAVNTSSPHSGHRRQIRRSNSRSEMAVGWMPGIYCLELRNTCRIHACKWQHPSARCQRCTTSPGHGTWLNAVPLIYYNLAYMFSQLLR